MKILRFSILLLLISSSNLFTQLHPIVKSKFTIPSWQETFGGTGNDNATCIINTLDGGFAISGNTYTDGVGDICLLKLNPDGSMQWSKKISTGEGDIANCLIQTADSCYIIVGATNFVSLDYYEDMFMVKINPRGELLWSKIFGSIGWDIAYTIKQTSDNGYIVAGYSNLSSSNYGVLIVKFNENGLIEWTKMADEVTNGLLSPAIIQTSDGGFGISGSYFTVFGGSDICFIKLNQFGLLQWSWIIGGANDEQAFSICQTPDNAYAITGFTNTYGAGYPDLYVVKLGYGGSILWTRTIGGDNDDYALSIVNSPDGGLVIGGESFSYGSGEIDMYLVKLDLSGRFIWGKTAGGTQYDFMRSIVNDYEGGYVAVGSTDNINYSDMYIVKSDSIGFSCSNSSNPVPHIDSGGAIIKFPINISTVSSSMSSINANISDWGNLSVLCLTGKEPGSALIPEAFSLQQNYPNPFNPVTKIRFTLPKSSKTKIVIHDLLGSEIKTLVNEYLSPGSYSVEWDGSAFASGVYLYSIITEGFTETKKMVLIK